MDSEDVSALVVDITEVVERGSVHHCLPVRNAPPYVSLHIFAILDRILLHLFNVPQLSRAISVPNAFIVALMNGVPSLKWSKQWLFLHRLLLLWEGDLGAEGCEVGLEATSLAHSIRPGLVTVKDLGVSHGVLSPD